MDPSIEKAEDLIRTELKRKSNKHARPKTVTSPSTKGPVQLSDEQCAALERALGQAHNALDKGRFPLSTTLDEWTATLKRNLVPDRIKMQIGRYLVLNCFNTKPEGVLGVHGITESVPTCLKDDLPVLLDWLLSETKIAVDPKDSRRFTLRNDLVAALKGNPSKKK